MSSKITDYMGMAANLYRPNRYSIRFDNVPETVNPAINSSQFNRSMVFMVENVFFPGRNIASEPIEIAGPVDEIPYSGTYSGDLDITMRISNNFKERVLLKVGWI